MGRRTAFVLLEHRYGGDNWHRKWRDGRLIGLNEPWAYGYHHAADHGFDVTYSEDTLPGSLWRPIQSRVHKALGFDFVHAWRLRKRIFASDVVWTHTEGQSLAVSLLCRLYRPRKRPKLILQSVWLMDQWDELPERRRRFYQGLLAEADLLSFHSPLNTERARALFPTTRCETILFGIRADDPRPPRARASAPLRILSIGNDRHRDWPTLVAAVKGEPALDLTILSGTCPQNLTQNVTNARVRQVQHNTELMALFEAADVVVVAVAPNLHASGITVIQEAVQMGLPVIATDAGGLSAYFDHDCVRWTPVGDAEALRRALLEYQANPEAALPRCVAAQARMAEGGINARSFVRQHVIWTNELIAADRTHASS